MLVLVAVLAAQHKHVPRLHEDTHGLGARVFVCEIPWHQEPHYRHRDIHVDQDLPRSITPQAGYVYMRHCLGTHLKEGPVKDLVG
jgi:hypothetical protein